ncbi:MAG: AtpZ/AtpI family protein [Alphaproteobacteria bacterium]|jgi:ATP synthase protein I|nr:AtpZ/AtpI family protein [Alphaproteobacteria bacterium]
MPDPVDSPEDPLGRLDNRIKAFEAGRRKTVVSLDQSAADGYRMLAQMLGGVLGGLGFGWLFDHLVGTAPLGLLTGLIFGAGLSIFASIRTALRLSARTAMTTTEPKTVKTRRSLSPASPEELEEDD